MFYPVTPMTPDVPAPDPSQIPVRISKHPHGSRRLTGMQRPIRPVAFSLARSLAMVALAILLILVLLPAALAAQAATAA